MVKKRKGHGNLSPQEVRELKRQMRGGGGGGGSAGAVSSYVRFEKNTNQQIGVGNTAPVVWQANPYNIGGGALLPTNRLVVPPDMAGLWRIKAILNLDGTTTVSNSNYRAEAWVNGSVHSYQSNQVSSARQATSRYQNEIELAVADEVQIQMTNNTASGTNIITIEPGSFATFEFMGAVS